MSVTTTDTIYSDDRVSVTYRHHAPQPVYVVEPAGQMPHGTLVVVHGICEHALRFLPLARDMAGRGLRVVLFHLHAHGTAPAQAKQTHWLAEAYFTETPEQIISRIERCDAATLHNFATIRAHNTRRMAATRMAEHVQQVRQVAALILQKALGPAGESFFIAGHSLGGLIVAEAGWRLGHGGPVRPSGVILLAPALRPVCPPQGGPVGRAIVNLSWHTRRHAALAPLGWLLHGTMALNVRLKTGWAHRWISDIEAHQRLHAMDPLILDRVTTGYLNRIEAQMSATMDRAATYPCDAILIAPANDPVVATAGTIEFAQRLREGVAGAKALRAPVQRESNWGTQSLSPSHPTLVVYENFYAHSPLHSSKHSDVMQHVEAWMNRFNNPDAFPAPPTALP